MRRCILCVPFHIQHISCLVLSWLYETSWNLPRVDQNSQNNGDTFSSLDKRALVWIIPAGVMFGEFSGVDLLDEASDSVPVPLPPRVINMGSNLIFTEQNQNNFKFL